jgi:hypothetical protein
MKRYSRLFKVLMFTVLLLSAIIIIFPSVSAIDKFFTYDSQLEVTYDEDVLNTVVFQPDGPPVTIPITIKHMVYVPDAIFSGFLLRILFLQTFMITSAQINLEIINPPEWAAMSLSNANPYVEIDTEEKSAETSLIIAAHDDAPAEGFTLQVKASIDPLLNNHVNAQEVYINIIFQPGYIPLINLYSESPNIVVSPQETVNIPIEITNLGNKQTIVRAKIIDKPDGWATLLPQSQIIIPSASDPGDNKELLTFSVTPPYGFGWHNEIETLILEFTPEFSPPTSGSNRSAFIGTPVQFQVNIRNRGFSTPGYEFVFLIAAISIILILSKKRLISNK